MPIFGVGDKVRQ